jgi:hypothetical protein
MSKLILTGVLLSIALLVKHSHHCYEKSYNHCNIGDFKLISDSAFDSPGYEKEFAVSNALELNRLVEKLVICSCSIPMIYSLVRHK